MASSIYSLLLMGNILLQQQQQQTMGKLEIWVPAHQNLKSIFNIGDISLNYLLID